MFLLLTLLPIACAMSMAAGAQAALVKKSMEYRDGNSILEGYLVFDDSVRGKRPGVLIVHEWWGLNDYAKKRAEEVARLGYVAFAVDMYGKGVRTSNPEEAGKWAGRFKGDRRLMRGRVQASLDELRKHEQVDQGRIAAIGYCFGGTTVLELARSGADVAGVVSFHGGLETPDPGARNMRAKVLILHGADDPMVPAKEVERFHKEMREAGVDWQMVSYGNAVHSFTNPESGSDPANGVAYNEKADRRSWEAMRVFFDEIFR
jgi:dienelactone hydrolase